MPEVDWSQFTETPPNEKVDWSQFSDEPPKPTYPEIKVPWYQMPGADLGPWNRPKEEALEEARQIALPALYAKAVEAIGKGAVQVADIPTRLANIGKEKYGPGYVLPLEDIPRPTLPRIPEGALQPGVIGAASPTAVPIPGKEELVTGLGNLAIGTVESLVPPYAKPEVGLTAPVLAGRGAIGKAAAGAYAGSIGVGLPQQISDAIDVLTDPKATKAEKTEALGNPVVQTAFGILMARHAGKVTRADLAAEVAYQLKRAELEPPSPTAPTPERRLGIGPVPTTPFEQPGIVDLADAALRERQQLIVPAGQQGQPAIEALRRAIEPPQVVPVPIATAERVAGGGEAPYGKVSYMRRAEPPTQIDQTVAKAGETLPVAAAEAEKGATDASKVSETTKVYGDVRPQPGEGAGKVPVKEGGTGVQPQAEEGIPGAEAEQGRLLLGKAAVEFNTAAPAATYSHSIKSGGKTVRFYDLKQDIINPENGEVQHTAKSSVAEPTLNKYGVSHEAVPETEKVVDYDAQLQEFLKKKAEPPPPVTGEAPRQPVPTGAAPEGERAPAVSAAEPPGTTKGDISTAKEQGPVERAAAQGQTIVAGTELENWANEQLKGGGTHLGPDVLAAYIVKGAGLLERGVINFADWSRRMIEEHGPAIQEHLNEIFAEAKALIARQPAKGTLKSSRDIVESRLAGRENARLSLARSAPTETPTMAAPPKINAENGAARKAPTGSVFAPDTPPNTDPHAVYPRRLMDTFKLWWDRVWPRDLAVSRLTPDSPVITAHQRLIQADVDYMLNFSKSDWWRAVRKYSEQELIDLEHQAVTAYRAGVAGGLPHDQAYAKALAGLPEDFQALVRHRESRRAIEVAASEILGVDPPSQVADPYVARLTNELGKEVVDLHPHIPNFGRQLRTTIGAFDNSRTYPTMQEGIANGVQYDPVRKAVWLRELTSARLEATANMLKELKGTSLFDKYEDALKASPNKRPWKVRGFGPNDYWARSRPEAIFLEQNLNMRSGGSALSRLTQLANSYIRNPSLVNPLPHVTKNMFFKYLMARVNNFTFRRDVAEYKSATPSELRARFDKVMPFPSEGERMPQITAREVGTWADKLLQPALRINNPSSRFIFTKADPAMRYSLWKSYVRKGMSDQAAANHVWIDLIRYDANSGAMSFWKSIPMNFFVPWRTGTYVTLAKAFTSHPIRTLLFVGAVEYLREIIYRKSGWWTHLPSDYLDAPLAEAVKNPKGAPGVAATTLLFGPGGGQAPNSIRDALAAVSGDPQNKARVMNMFWGLSQIYNLPREWNAYQKDKNPAHLVHILESAAFGSHPAIKYTPRRLMEHLPEWMPGLEKSRLVKMSEALQAKVQRTREKAQRTYETRHSVSRTFETAPEQQQLEELRRAAGSR